jgi:hypothetical protein
MEAFIVTCLHQPAIDGKYRSMEGRGQIIQAGNIFFLVLILFFSAIALSWLVSNVSGEYRADYGKRSDYPNLGSIHISLLQTATGIEGSLSHKGSPLLKLTKTSSIKDGAVHLDFQSENTFGPDKLAMFSGKLSEGKLTGTLTEGDKSYDLALERDPFASSYRQFQSQFSFVGDLLEPIFRLVGAG